MGTTVFARAVLLVVPGMLCLLAPAGARAEQPALALPQVVELSLRNNVDLKSFRAEKGIRDAAKTRAGLFPNPILDLEGATGALTRSATESSLSLGVSQEFLLAGKREKRLAIAERDLEIYRWQEADRERTLRQEVKAAFYDAVLAQQRIALTERGIVLNRQLLDLAQERLAAGDVAELEVNLVQVELARSEAARVAQGDALVQSQARLRTLMGLSEQDLPALAGALDAQVPQGLQLKDLQAAALRNRPDLKALAAEQSRGAAELTLARAEAIPNLSAGISLARDTSSIEVGGVEGRDTAYTLGLKLSIPIPLFDRNQAGVQEARARQNSAETRLAAASRAIEREVEAACASLANAGRVLELYRKGILPQLEENLKLTQEAYRLGEVGILAVIEEHRKFLEVNDGDLAARHGRLSALVKLESALATDLTGGVQ